MIGHLLLKDAGDFEFLFGHSIPFKVVALKALYHAPGVLLALLCGLILHVMLSEIVRRISQKVVDSRYFNLIWLVAVAYVLMFTHFTTKVAQKTGWEKVFQTRQVQHGGPRVREIQNVDEQHLNKYVGQNNYGARPH